METQFTSPSAPIHNDPTGQIFDIRRFSTHDGPGIRTTIFFKGCPLRCLWCHNPESQRFERQLTFHPSRCIHCGVCIPACPNGAIQDRDGTLFTDPMRCRQCGTCVSLCAAEARQFIGREMTVTQVMREIMRDVPFYEESQGGVTISGGEPLAQPEFLIALLLHLREQGIHTALDTSGCATWEDLDALRDLVDLFLYDVKIVDPLLHERYTGVPNAEILQNLEHLCRLGHAVIVRYPLIPGLNDQPAAIDDLVTLIHPLPNVLRIDLLPYHKTAQEKYNRLGLPYPLADIQPPTEERLDAIKRRIEECGISVQIGG